MRHVNEPSVTMFEDSVPVVINVTLNAIDELALTQGQISFCVQVHDIIFILHQCLKCFFVQEAREWSSLGKTVSNNFPTGSKVTVLDKKS